MKKDTNSEGLSFEAMNSRKDELVPKVGFNLVGVDAFEMGADALFFVGHFDTRAEAEVAKKAKEKNNNLDKFYIYDPQTR